MEGESIQSVEVDEDIVNKAVKSDFALVIVELGVIEKEGFFLFNEIEIVENNFLNNQFDSKIIDSKLK